MIGSVVNRTCTLYKILIRTRFTQPFHNVSKVNISTKDTIAANSKIASALTSSFNGFKSNIPFKLDYIREVWANKGLGRVINTIFGDLRRRILPYRFQQRYYVSTNLNGAPKVNINSRIANTVGGPKRPLVRPKQVASRGIQSTYEYARRNLVNNILRGVTNSLAADLRRQSVRQLFNGNPSRFFALVGISLASDTGIVTKLQECEGVCWEIRESICRMRKNLYIAETNELEDDISLNSLEFGSVIDKGSNAVIYEARVKKCPQTDSLQNVGNAKDKYPLAVKMMFNYEAESNAISILRSMYRETVPLENVQQNASARNFWENEMVNRIQRLPPHENVIKMFRSFTDNFPDLPESKSLYPDALPFRLNPHGSGRNMSLFLVMKKYQMNLKQYLLQKAPDIREGILLLTQLLEAVTHFNKYEIAHRDLKSDNILLDMNDVNEKYPSLVVADFGCCLADKQHGLNMPYRVPDVDRGGNAALMAPEVITAQPGLFSSINYSKADVWTVGTLAYEIFTRQNPFYENKNQSGSRVLLNATYVDDMLPTLPAEVPPIIARVIRSILIRNPSKRLDAETAATVCQLYLWAPSYWLSNDKIPSNSDILQWLLSMTTKVLYEGPMLYRPSEKRLNSTAEFQIIITFLQRVKLETVKKALSWIHEL